MNTIRPLLATFLAFVIPAHTVADLSGKEAALHAEGKVLDQVNSARYCAADPGIYEESFEFAGFQREYILYRPGNLTKQAPLVFLLHGYTGTAAEAIESYGMNAIADANGFAVVYPQGLKFGELEQRTVKNDSGESVDISGPTLWNAYPSMGLELDDAGFLAGLAKHLQKKCDLDAKRTFISGHSAGGAMSYTAACEQSEVFKAAASVAGGMSENDSCNPSRPLPVLHVHGAADDVVPLTSATDPASSKASHSINDVVLFWAGINQYETLEEGFLPPKTKTYRYKNSFNANEVWYYEIADWGHWWPRTSHGVGIETGQVIGEFFSQY